MEAADSMQKFCEMMDGGGYHSDTKDREIHLGNVLLVYIRIWAYMAIPGAKVGRYASWYKKEGK